MKYAGRKTIVGIAIVIVLVSSYLFFTKGIYGRGHDYGNIRVEYRWTQRPLLGERFAWIIAGPRSATERNQHFDRVTWINPDGKKVAFDLEPETLFWIDSDYQVTKKKIKVDVELLKSLKTKSDTSNLPNFKNAADFIDHLNSLAQNKPTLASPIPPRVD